MDLASIIQWITNNYLAVFGILYGALNVFNAVAGLTPGEGDNRLASRLLSIVDRLSALTPGKATGTLKVPGFRSK